MCGRASCCKSYKDITNEVILPPVVVAGTFVVDAAAVVDAPVRIAVVVVEACMK